VPALCSVCVCVSSRAELDNTPDSAIPQHSVLGQGAKCSYALTLTLLPHLNVKTLFLLLPLPNLLEVMQRARPSNNPRGTRRVILSSTLKSSKGWGGRESQSQSQSHPQVITNASSVSSRFSSPFPFSPTS
jgi:hypothetical protein